MLWVEYQKNKKGYKDEILRLLVNQPSDPFTLMILAAKLHFLMFKFFSICRRVSSSFGKTCPFLTNLLSEKVTTLKSFLVVVPYPYGQNEYRSFVKDTNIWLKMNREDY